MINWKTYCLSIVKLVVKDENVFQTYFGGLLAFTKKRFAVISEIIYVYFGAIVIIIWDKLLIYLYY